MGQHDFLSCGPVYLGELCILSRGLGKLMAHVLKADIVYLSHTSTVPCAEVAHIVVNKKVIGLNILRPTVLLIVEPAKPFAVNNHAGDKKFLHCSRIQLGHSVELHIILQHR